MRRQGRRIAIGVGLAGVVVIAVLVLVNRSAVRDHVEAWRFQFTRKTWALGPEGVSLRAYEAPWVEAFPGYPVIFAPAEVEHLNIGNGRFQEATADFRKTLDADGFRVLEQRFPRKAYVVIRGEKPAPR